MEAGRPPPASLAVAAEDDQRNRLPLIAQPCLHLQGVAFEGDLKALGDPARRNFVEPTGTAHGSMGPTRMDFTRPVIAAIEGHAMAGGLKLALMCDLRVASRSAVLGVFCRRWGVPLIDGGTVRLQRVVGLIRQKFQVLVESSELTGSGRSGVAPLLCPA